MATARVRICGCSHEEARHELVGGHHVGPCSHGCGCPAFHPRRRESGGTRIVHFEGVVHANETPTDASAAIAQAFAAVSVAKSALFEAEEALRAAARLCKLNKSSTYGKPQNSAPAAAPPPPQPPRSAGPTRAARSLATAGNGLPKGVARVLVAVGQYPGGVTREQLSVLTGYKKSSRDTYLKRLHGEGLVWIDAGHGGRFCITSSGIKRLPEDFRSLPTGEELVSYWREKLSAGESLILDCLLAAHPARVGKEQIDRSTGYKKSSRDTYIKRLRSRELVCDHGDGNVSLTESFALAAELRGVA